MDVFDTLPSDLRGFLNEMDFNLHDDHLMRGTPEIIRVKALYEAGVPANFIETGRN